MTSALGRARSSLILEILLAYDRIERLVSLGKRLGDAGTLPNVDGVLRRSIKIEKGTKIDKNWPEHGGVFRAEVVDCSRALTSLHHDGSERPVYKVHYLDDDEEEELEEEEIRPLLVIDCLQVHAPTPARVHKPRCYKLYASSILLCGTRSVTHRRGRQ